MELAIDGYMWVQEVDSLVQGRGLPGKHQEGVKFYVLVVVDCCDGSSVLYCLMDWVEYPKMVVDEETEESYVCIRFWNQCMFSMITHVEVCILHH